ncbi:MAG TPA: ABC transporter substrate-binding protein [Methylophaga aminisulfidivorans]|jgi:iron complex transport system substrate-binding protein|uniref:ABC transporter substrate-binding protein n=1 Tax=Methylophaga TaxID=40222 RepID=UPI001A13BF21|nr:MULTISPECIES: helical backbone metal receptor [Methylophaga]HIM40787.1 ABC transporter substrate-binding protein [Methylophaga aminisulfidivorans]
MRRFWPLVVFIMIFCIVWLLADNAQKPLSTVKNYQRIITLSPSLTETVFALGLGDHVVAVTDYCDYPAQAQALPSVGSYTNTSLEAITRLQPDLVIMLNGQQQRQQQLEQLGIKTLVLDNSTIADIKETIQKIADLTDRQNEADKLLTSIQAQIDYVHNKVRGLVPVRTLVGIAHYVNSDQLDTVYIAGQHDFYNELLKLAGGVNVYTDTTVKVPSVSAEGIIRMNPDAIIDVFPEQKDHQSDMKQVIKQWQSLRNVNAVKQQRIYIIEHDYASIPGPRIFKLLPEMAQLLHPELDWQDHQLND